MLKIGVDYDKTFTADPDLWFQFMHNATDRGHKVFIVTYRDDRFDGTELLQEVLDNGFEVLYTRGVAKEFWCAHFGPGKVDIWIDDDPKRIYENSRATPEFLVGWRAGGSPHEC